jgi:CHAT domain-containing protein/Flp pilus assembly protein TadD
MALFTTRRLLSAATISFFFLQIVPAGSQEPGFETSLISVVRAVSRGEARKALVFYEERIRYFEGLAKASELPNPWWAEAGRAYREASNAAHFLGDLHKAIVYGEKALALAEKHGRRSLELATLSSLVWAHRSARNFSQMEELIERALRLSQEWPEESLDWLWWHGVFYLHRSGALRRLQRFDEAIQDYHQVIRLKNEFLNTIPGIGRAVENRKALARTNILSAYAGLGETYSSLGQQESASGVYHKGLEAAREWKLDFHESRFHLGLGHILRRRKEFAGALDHFDKALDLGRRQQRPDVISNAARRIGDVLRETGKPTEAIVFYRQAIQEIESVRSLLAAEGTRQNYFGGWLGAYWRMTETLWETGAHDQAFHYGERVRSRAFLDMLGTKVHLTRTKNEDALGLGQSSDPEDSEEAYRAFFEQVLTTDPEQASLMTVEPLTLKEVQALLEPGQALLEYLVTPRKTYLWVIERNQAHGAMIPLTQKALAAKVQELRTAISELRPAMEYQKLALDFYRQLIAPAIPFVKGKELIIVPHDALHYLPFQALYSPQGKYLVEDHSLTYLSSASLLQFVKEKRQPVGQRILAFGNPTFDAKADLPMSELEANEIRRLYSQTTIFVKSAASEANVKSAARNYDVLHFATHAELRRDDPLSSAVLLAKSEKEDGRLEVREIFGMSLNASLVVLSGCETGLGQLSSGDELVGLTRAFIYAGTPSVVASLWKVDDASTAHLMSSFYKNLKSKTKVESLRQAQLDMIRGKVTAKLLAQRGVGGIGKLGQTGAARSSSRASISTSHPYFWAPFILVGDGK